MPEDKQDAVGPKPRTLFLKRGGHMHRRFRNKVFLIPSLITVGGLFCGFLAIVSAHNERYIAAVGYILLAFVFDGVDGRVARRLNATSAFGREFDSLSDLVAFGVAPAVLTYCWAFAKVAEEFGVLVSFLIVACGAARLARFNIMETTDAKHHFEGLPTPAAAAAVVGLVYFHPEPLTSPGLVGAVLLYLIAISILMVSTFPFYSIKHLRLMEGNPRRNLFLISAVLALGWYQPRAALLIGTFAYVASGPIWHILKKKKTELAPGTEKAQAKL